MYTVMFQRTFGAPSRFRGNLFATVFIVVVLFELSGTERICLCMTVWADDAQVLQSVICVYAVDVV